MKRRPYAALGVALLALSLLGSLVLIGAALQNSERFGALFSMLLLTNGLGLAGFVILLVSNVRQLVGQLRSRQAGARLTLRMVLMFVSLSVTPLLVLYGFSLDFLKRGTQILSHKSIKRLMRECVCHDLPLTDRPRPEIFSLFLKKPIEHHFMHFIRSINEARLSRIAINPFKHCIG